MSKASDSRAAYLLGLELGERQQLLAKMSKRQHLSLRHHWRLWAHAGQLPPEGEWHSWLILAGRGFGKTRAGAEWVRAIAPRGQRPRFEPSRRLLTWPNGAQAMLYSAGEPESLRGPQHSHARRPKPA